MALLLVGLFYCFIVAVQAQVTCRASVDCNGNSGDNLGEMTIEKCCLETPNGLGFSEGESCSACIVYGFINDSFVGKEQGEGHTVQAGYLKGAEVAETNLVFTVIDIPGTAKKGSGFDYTVSTTRVRALFNIPTSPGDVLFIFRMDAIAQEKNETLTLELDLLPSITLPTGRNVFFKNTINLTIIDNDEVEIMFTEDDFRMNERNMTHPDNPTYLPVLVTKTSRIANPIVLDVIPLTVEMASAVLELTNMSLNIPDAHPFSPPFADFGDFENTTIRITFDPDELSDDNERAAPIQIFNDAVNEANEQVFVVQLSLINSTNASSVILDRRPASVCRIIDDDIIRIGFEEERYTYLEPKFDTDIPSPSFMPLSNSTAHGPIYLAKEDNVQSEQTFRIIVQTADSVPSGEVNINSATINQDYSIGGRVATIDFFPTMQKVRLPLTLFPDDSPEGTEGFRVSSSPEDKAQDRGMEFDLSDYLPPVNLSAETYVIIEDDEAIIIGFEETNYIVNESVGALEVYVSVISPPAGVEFFGTINLGIQSVNRTATGDTDYEEIDLSAFDVLLQFDNDNRRQSFSVTINDDELLESIEDFNLELRFDTSGGQAAPSGVELSPNVSTVYIEDNDDTIVVGFVERMYTFIENSDAGTIQVRKNDVSSVPFQVRVFGGPSTSSPIHQSAKAVNQTITFGAGLSAPDVIPVQIPITGDDIALEAIESYDVNLEIVGSPTNVFIGRHEMTTVNVLDEDLVTVGFGSSGVTVNESSGEFRMCVVKDRVAVQDVTVTIVSQHDTASPNSDYNPSGIPETVTIPASDPRACFTGPIIDDLIALEPDETFTLRISNISPDTNRIQRGIETTRITITDDDFVRVKFEKPNYVFREESGLATVCLVKDLETTAGFDIETVTSDNTANDGSDYVGGPFTVNFGTSTNEVQCRQIIIFSDNEREDRENFFVHLNLADTGKILHGDPNRTFVAIEDTSIHVNDTVIGDPLMTVPILVRNKDLQNLNTDRLSLCYEIHGHAGVNFNFVTDECTTVNAHYTNLTSYLNVIDRIGVRTVDNNGTCRNIQVNVDGCSAFVDESLLEVGSKYNFEGISVRSYSNRVRISVPNCNEVTLVMWVICETRTIGTVTGNMIKFVVMRGLNFGHRQAHGLLGQFWNVPVSVEPFTGIDRDGKPVSEHYVINITSTFSNVTRSYTGRLYDLTWSFEKSPCLYVGNSQGGPIYEVKDPNDPIIEGSYFEYIVPDLFSDNFAYGFFAENNCQQ